MKASRNPFKTARSAFSLIELMVSISVLSLLLVIVFQMLEQMQKTYKRTRQTVSEFKDARNGFEEMGRRLGQASMNAYYGYDYKTTSLNGIPTRYGREIIRESELHFVSGPSSVLFQGATAPSGGSRPGHAVFFQAPFGFCIDRDVQNKNRLQFEQLNNLLNAWGFFVEFNSDELERPEVINKIKNAPTPRLRYRLMEFRQPTEYLQVYKLGLRSLVSPSQKKTYEWFTEGLFAVNSKWNYDPQAAGATGGGGGGAKSTFFRTTRAVAENILAMVISPREAESTGSEALESLSPQFLYDTRRWQWGSAGTALAVRTRHQLPPIMDISFIAVDETSFATYATRTGIKGVENDPKIIPDDIFVEAKKLTKDYEQIEAKLKALKLDYRIFSTTVRLRESKWSES